MEEEQREIIVIQLSDFFPSTSSQLHLRFDLHSFMMKYPVFSCSELLSNTSTRKTRNKNRIVHFQSRKNFLQLSWNRKTAQLSVPVMESTTGRYLTRTCNVVRHNLTNILYLAASVARRKPHNHTNLRSFLQ